MHTNGSIKLTDCGRADFDQQCVKNVYVHHSCQHREHNPGFVTPVVRKAKAGLSGTWAEAAGRRPGVPDKPAEVFGTISIVTRMKQSLKTVQCASIPCVG